MSQGGNNNISGGGGVVGVGSIGNLGSGQGCSNSGNGVKSNSKMSIDHQATLDKGLKMKIKRTKPGTKTSEAKHEIVKASEQQNGTSLSNTNLNDNALVSTNNVSCCTPNSSSTSNSSSNISTGMTSNCTKKHISSANNTQNNTHSTLGSNIGCIIQANSNSGSNISNSGTPNHNQGTKRGSSTHRRDKTKEKSAHSNRLSVDKNLSSSSSSSSSNDKDGGEKLSCQCNGDIITSNNSTSCSNMCVRRSDINCKLNEHNHNSSGVPVTSTALITSSATSVNCSTLSKISSSSCSAANAPGPPSKDAISVGNLKVSAYALGGGGSNTFNPNSTGVVTSGISNANSNLVEVKAASFSCNNNNIGHGAKHMAPGVVSATVHHTITVPFSSHSSGVPKNCVSPLKTNCSTSSNMQAEDHSRSPPSKRSKYTLTELNTEKEMVDICVGTSVGTITEPDCLGPCEPGTSVTLEGIVWHETEGGVLVVNVTWRGKTYVGTLLDCTRHDWAPPRFCESPTEELDSRTPKGRGKRGRNATLTPDLSNFTETRSSIYFSHVQVHSKLRNGSTKGGRTATRTSNNTTTSTNSGVSNASSTSSSGNGTGGVSSTPSTSPTAFIPTRPEKRKSNDESPPPTNGETEMCSINMANASGIPISASGGGLATQPQSLLNPVTGLNVQINTKKCKTASPSAISPVLLECPEQDCSKKYKHPNGLRYHQSHAHGSGTSIDEDSTYLPENEEPPSPPPPSPPPAAPTPTATSNSNDVPNNVSSPNPVNIPPSEVSGVESTSSSNTFATVATVPSSESISSDSPSQSAVTNVTQTNTSNVATGSLISNATQNHEQQLSGNSTIPSGSSITAGISNQLITQQKQQQQQQQLIDMATNNSSVSSTNTMEQNVPHIFSPSNAVKSGVLRFGQPNDPTNSKMTNLRSTNATTMLQTQLNPQQLPIVPVVSASTSSSSGDQNQLRPLTNVISGIEFNAQSAMQQQNMAMANKSIASFGLVGKQKKNRKSPGPGEFDEGGNAGSGSTNISSRDEVQSPAYSDISDDSNPITDGTALDKSESTKHLELLNKKPQDIEIGSTSGPHTLSTELGGYNMYQFFQQQQFIVQPSLEQHHQTQLNKGNVQGGIVQSSNQLGTPQNSQHLPTQLVPPQNLSQIQQSSSHLEYNTKIKDPPLDLITKNTGNLQNHQISDCNKSQDLTHTTQSNTNNLNSSCGQTCGTLGANINNVTPLGAAGLPPSSASKPIPHFYPFNYMTSGYPYNVESNYGPVSIVSSEDAAKLTSNSDNQSTGDHISQQLPTAMIKEERIKDVLSPQENLKTVQQNMNPNKIIKTEPPIKQEAIKLDPNTNINLSSQPVPQQPLALHPKDMQAYTNIYQRHPISLTQQQLSREEELRRYYVFSDQQRRQNNALQGLNVNNQQVSTVQPGHIREDTNSNQQQHQQQQQQQHSVTHQQSLMKFKQNSSNVNHMPLNKVNTHSKDPPKQKQEEDTKIGKQEGQKPTMETQGPPPPPTSQYFLHPSYIAPTPFGFDPNHPMYRNVLMSTTPYNTQPYHLSMPRYHAPEDLSRNTTTKALDALHHAASQYYTTHKIHELTERALKSPNSVGNSNNNNSGAVKVSISSPNIGTPQQNASSGNISHHHSNLNQSGNTQHLSMPSHSSSGTPSSKSQDVLGHKPHGSNSGHSSQNSSHHESQKQQPANAPPSNNATGNTNPNSNPSDSRSPPPQRHVHTHHHTHVGLGYPMYPAPYGAAVLASQQAAAVAVINPFPPAPSK